MATWRKSLSAWSLEFTGSPSRWGWAFVITALVLAGILRFYNLGHWPPGPYRDEAYNGLDALGVLEGNHALFFPANNGREPAYIYLVAAAISFLGPTMLALRLPAAIAGTLAVIPAYLLGQAWFGRVAGGLAALLLAMTFWPVHLGRIGLRAGLLGPLLALALWLGTSAYRKHRGVWWLAAGLVYGLTFYTYLAARLTPFFLLLLAVYLVATGRRRALWDEGRILWFFLGAALVVAPFAWLLGRDPSLILGRAGQVSVLNPEIHGGNPAGALVSQTGKALGMFFWRGDTILRHNALLNYEVVLRDDNPLGRPVFDPLMAVPFVLGVGWCMRQWRRPAAAAILLWQLVMLLPTILAEDPPHFLRAAGLLPGVVFFPAIGLSLLWGWTRLPVLVRRGAVVLLLLGSLSWTIRDYARYAVQPDVAFLFEAAAAELAASAREKPADGTVYMDQRFLDGWPSVRFLLGDRHAIPFHPEAGLPNAISSPAAIYVWPYGPQDFLPVAIDPPAAIAVEAGPLARGDLEPEPYSLYTRYGVTPGETTDGLEANFANHFALRAATVELTRPETITLDLRWDKASMKTGAESSPHRLPNLFIHVNDPEGVIAQYDGPLAGGLWPAGWWQSGLLIDESRAVELPISFDPARHTITIGLYWPDTGERLPVLDARGRLLGDQLVIQPAD